jgi:hypothetical protein
MVSLIQAGQLRLPNQENGHANGHANGNASHREPLPYLGAVGTIPLSVASSQVRHHPGADPNGAGKASNESR